MTAPVVPKTHAILTNMHAVLRQGCVIVTRSFIPKEDGCVNDVVSFADTRDAELKAIPHFVGNLKILQIKTC
jgi:hypothetical protein